MNETMLKRYATAWKWLQVAAAVLAIGGSAIAFCPVWWGNDWSEASVLLWFGGVAGMALIVWLSVLSRCLSRAGHDIHAALVNGLVLPLTSRMAGTIGHRDAPFPTTFQGVLDQYLWGYPGLAILVILLVLAIINTIGRRSSWKYFHALRPEQTLEAGSGSGSGSNSGRVDGIVDAIR